MTIHQLLTKLGTIVDPPYLPRFHEQVFERPDHLRMIGRLHAQPEREDLEVQL